MTRQLWDPPCGRGNDQDMSHPRRVGSLHARQTRTFDRCGTASEPAGTLSSAGLLYTTTILYPLSCKQRLCLKYGAGDSIMEGLRH